MAGSNKRPACSIYEQAASGRLDQSVTEYAGEVIYRQRAAYWQGIV